MKRSGVCLAVAMCSVVLVAAPPAQAKGKPDPAAIKAVKALVKAQLASLYETSYGDGELPPDIYTAEAAFWLPWADGGLVGAKGLYARGELTGKNKASAPTIVLAADGSAAWVTFDGSFTDGAMGDDVYQAWRVSQLVVKDAAGWRVAAGAWSQGMADKEVHRRAQEGSQRALAPLVAADTGPKDFLDAVAAPLRAGGGAFAALVSTRADLIGIGSAEKEKTKGGKKLAKAWTAWGATVSVEGAVAGAVAPGGSVGWLMAQLKVQKQKDGKSYAIPFRAFFVLEQEGGAWKVAHVHLVVPW